MYFLECVFIHPRDKKEKCVTLVANALKTYTLYQKYSEARESPQLL